MKTKLGYDIIINDTDLELTQEEQDSNDIIALLYLFL